MWRWKSISSCIYQSHRQTSRNTGLPVPQSSLKNFGWSIDAAGYASQATRPVSLYGGHAEHKEEVLSQWLSSMEAPDELSTAAASHAGLRQTIASLWCQKPTTALSPEGLQHRYSMAIVSVYCIRDPCLLPDHHMYPRVVSQCGSLVDQGSDGYSSRGRVSCMHSHRLKAICVDGVQQNQCYSRSILWRIIWWCQSCAQPQMSIQSSIADVMSRSITNSIYGFGMFRMPRRSGRSTGFGDMPGRTQLIYRNRGSVSAVTRRGWLES